MLTGGYNLITSSGLTVYEYSAVGSGNDRVLLGAGGGNVFWLYGINTNAVPVAIVFHDVAVQPTIGADEYFRCPLNPNGLVTPFSFPGAAPEFRNGVAFSIVGGGTPFADGATDAVTAGTVYFICGWAVGRSPVTA